MSEDKTTRKSYQTSLIFDFEREGVKKQFKFGVNGESLQDIKNNAIDIQKEICQSIYRGQSPEIKTIRFEFGDEILA